MTEFRNQTLSGEIALDGHTFADVTFRNAGLVYAGGPPPLFGNCAFDNARFRFEGSAGATLTFLKAMAGPSTNMRQVVLGLIPELND